MKEKLKENCLKSKIKVARYTCGTDSSVLVCITYSGRLCNATGNIDISADFTRLNALDPLK